MPAPDRADPSSHLGLRVGGPPRNVSTVSLDISSRVRSWIPIQRWSAYAWSAIGATTAFVAITCWWLTQDRSIPIYDAGDHLELTLVYRNMLAAGNLLGPFTQTIVYPPLGHLVGAIAALIGGVNVASPIIGENVVFVPLLALGCYQTGRLLFGSFAGLLAVVFVLGSPLIISLFHVFMLDAPLTAMVAVAVWLILASEDFGRPGIAGLAGLTVGLGVNIKVQFALFVAGLTLIVLLHGGWRNRRGFAIFAAVALAVGLPWYLVHFSELGEMFELASSGPGTPQGNIPPTISTVNLAWYFWSIMNSQLLAPLFLLLIAGTAWMLVTLVRDRDRDRERERDRHVARLEFCAGAFLAWFVITFVTPHHDIRYGLPLLGYLAVIGTGWIVHLPRRLGLVAIAVLVLGVSANTLGNTFGVGKEVKVVLTGSSPETEQIPDRIVVYTTYGFLASAPKRDGDVPGLLETLRREGVHTVLWSVDQTAEADFSLAGLTPLALIAKLSPEVTRTPEYVRSASVATLVHKPTVAGSPPTCTRLSDGTGVWVVRYDPAAGRLAYFCPGRDPRFYDAGAVR